MLPPELDTFNEMMGSEEWRRAFLIVMTNNKTTYSTVFICFIVSPIFGICGLQGISCSKL